jgi:hypothetical protein
MATITHLTTVSARLLRHECEWFLVRVSDRIERVYRASIRIKNWWVVRYCAVRMRKTIDSMAPSITTILVRGKRVRLYSIHIMRVSVFPVNIGHARFERVRHQPTR